MARVTVEDCIDKVDSPYELVLVAKERATQLNSGIEPSVDKDNDTISKECIQMVRNKIGPVAAFKIAIVVKRLPKTRSGKIMRRILRKIAANEHDQLGDTTTLADPSVVKSLVDERKNI